MGIYRSDYPFEELSAYTGTYLKEKIQSDAAVRSLEPFLSFFYLIAAKVG